MDGCLNCFSVGLAWYVPQAAKAKCVLMKHAVGFKQIQTTSGASACYVS